MGQGDICKDNVIVTGTKSTLYEYIEHYNIIRKHVINSVESNE